MQGDQLPGNLETLESLTAAVGELWGDWTEIMEELWKKTCHGKLLISDFTTWVAAVFVKLFQVTSCYLFEGFCCVLNHVERFCRMCTDIYSILITLTLAVCIWPQCGYGATKSQGNIKEFHSAVSGHHENQVQWMIFHCLPSGLGILPHKFLAPVIPSLENVFKTRNVGQCPTCRI